MKAKFILLTITSILSFAAFAQDAKKMSKHLTVFVTGKFDSRSPISFTRMNPNKHGWDNVTADFKTVFLKYGFNVIDAVSGNTNSGYTLTMDYAYGYVISQYRMQYSNLKGQIVDLNNNSTIVGNFEYNGRFEVENVANAIAIRLKAVPIKDTTEPQKLTAKSKEERLRELKDIFDKQLITKDEYEREKKRVLEE